MRASDYLRELRPNAVWELLWILVGPTVVAVTTAVVQKIRAVPLDGWVLGAVFVASLILFVYVDKRNREGRFSKEGDNSLGESQRGPRGSWGSIIITALVSVVFGFGLGVMGGEKEVNGLSRHLTPEQKAAFVESLQGKEPRDIEVWTLGYPTTEAGRYAQDFIEIFVEAGWTVRKKIIRGNLAPAHPSFFFQRGDPVASPLAGQLREVDSEIYTEGVAYSNPIRFTIRPRPDTER